MSDLPLFEFLVYFVPGIFTAIGAGLLLLRVGVVSDKLLAGSPALTTVCLVAVAFAAGLATHVLGTYLVILLYSYLVTSPVWEVSQYFRETGAHSIIQDRVVDAVGVTPTNDLDLYWYCQYLLINQGGGLWDRVVRLQGLSLLCRNLMISLMFLGVGMYFFFSMWKLGFLRNGFVLVGGVALLFLLLKGTVNYSSAAAYAVYRGVLIFTGP